jgi:cytochrome d ubiquinol oxidase subunit I
VGISYDGAKPVLNDIWAVLTNSTVLAAFPHTIAGAIAVAGGFLIGIAWYQLWQRRKDGIDTVDAKGRVIVGEAPEIPGRDKADHAVWLKSLRIGAVVAIIGFGAVSITGDIQGKLMYEQQPLKMAAAEAACHTGTSFSVLSIGKLGAQDCSEVVPIIEIPGVLSFLAKGDFTTEMPGLNELIPQYEEKYGTHLPDNELYGERAGTVIDYMPNLEVTYWGFRIMIGFGMAAAFAAVVALWLTRKGTVPRSKPIMQLAIFGILAPFGANAAGWIFTEMGRQPFVVAPNPNPSGVDGVFMFTAAAVSPGVDGREIVFSLVSLGLVYLVLMIVEVMLLARFVRAGVAGVMPERFGLGDDGQPEDGDDDADNRDDVLAFAY